MSTGLRMKSVRAFAVWRSGRICTTCVHSVGQARRRGRVTRGWMGLSVLHQRTRCGRRLSQAVRRRLCVRCAHVTFCARSARKAARWERTAVGAPVSRRVGGGKARRVADRMSTRFSPAHGCAVENSRNPHANSEGRSPESAIPGWPLFWLHFLWPNREK